MRLNLLASVLFLSLCALLSLTEAQPFVKRTAAYHVKTILREQAYNSTHYPIGITFHPVRKTYYTVWRGYNTVFVRPPIVDTPPSDIFTKGTLTAQVDKTFSYVNGINFQRNITGLTNHRGIFYCDDGSYQHIIVLSDGAGSNTLFAGLDVDTLDRLWDSSLPFPTGSAGGLVYNMTGYLLQYGFRWIRYDNSSRAFQAMRPNGAGYLTNQMNTIALTGTENKIINPKTRMFQAIDTNGKTRRDSATLFDNVTGQFRTYAQNNEIFEHYIKADCSNSSYADDAFLGATQDGLYWLWDQANGVYKGFDVNYNWFETSADSIQSITPPANYTFPTGDTSVTTCYNPNVHPNITGYPAVTIRSGDRLGLNAMSHAMAQYHGWESDSVNLGLGTNRTCPSNWSSYKTLDNLHLRRPFVFLHPYSNNSTTSEQVINHKLFADHVNYGTYLRLGPKTSPQECGIPVLPLVYDCSLRVNPQGSNFPMVFSENASLSSGACSRPVKRTYNWTGCAGGQQIDPAANFHEVILQDTRAPSVSAAGYTSFTCNISTRYLVTASDACFPPNLITITHSDVFIQSTCLTTTGFSRIVNRTITVTDPCGNQAKTNQIIQVANLVWGRCTNCP